MNASRYALGRSLRLASVATLSALTFLVPTIAAQDGDEAHPAHIHSGACAELGDVVIPLTDVTLPEGQSSGPESVLAVKLSETTVDVPLQEIIDGGHAINVHLSAEEIGTYIACGDIGGIVHDRELGEGIELTMGLGELNDSGHFGVAWLASDGEGTHVTVELVEAGEASASAEAAQEASPAAADASAEAIAVEIIDFAYDPPTIEVPVGGSISWTNADNVPHTATGIDREALQSGTLQPGDTFSQTFDTAGTFEYFCEFHPNMEGSIVVE